MATYRNSCHRPATTLYGPEFFVTDVKPLVYRGCLIYHRLPDCYDVVLDGVCVGQLAGPNGARRFIDERLDLQK